ncbi:MAG: hypothetical protein FWF29_06655 [Treponema sp.]|nr:hypothetical protein [Treponema sp.]
MEQRHIEKTLAYLASERGQQNWLANAARGYTPDMNLCVAVQTATRILKYEKLIEIMNVIEIERIPA